MSKWTIEMVAALCNINRVNYNQIFNNRGDIMNEEKFDRYINLINGVRKSATSREYTRNVYCNIIKFQENKVEVGIEWSDSYLELSHVRGPWLGTKWCVASIESTVPYFTDQQFERLINTIAANNTLQGLVFGNQTLTERQAIKLVEVIGAHKSLVHIEFDDAISSSTRELASERVKENQSEIRRRAFEDSISAPVLKWFGVDHTSDYFNPARHPGFLSATSRFASDTGHIIASTLGPS